MEWVRLGNVAEVIMGQSPKSEYCNDNKEGFPFYQGVSDFGEIFPVPTKYCTEPKKMAEIDDVLIGVRAPVGDLNISNAKCCIGRGVAAIRANEKFISKKYLFYFLLTQKQYFEINSTGSTFKAINKSVLSETLIPIIEINNQKTIENILDRIVNIIRKRKEQIQACDDLIESLFFEMFGDVRINDKNFLLKKWKDVLNIVNGKNQKKVENPKGKFPIYGSGGIMSYADDWLTKENSIIIGRKGNINKPIFVKEKFWNVDTAFGLEPNTNILNANYLFGFCQIFNFERLNKAVTIPSLTKKDLLEIDIPIPPIELQNKFADYVLKIEEEKKKLNASLLELEDLFDSLMEDAFSGNLFKN